MRFCYSLYMFPIKFWRQKSTLSFCDSGPYRLLIIFWEGERCQYWVLCRNEKNQALSKRSRLCPKPRSRSPSWKLSDSFQIPRVQGNGFFSHWRRLYISLQDPIQYSVTKWWGPGAGSSAIFFTNLESEEMLSLDILDTSALRPYSVS